MHELCNMPTVARVEKVSTNMYCNVKLFNIRCHAHAKGVLI